MTIGDLASLLVALATTGSLIYVSRQVNVSRRQAKGQFLLALDAQFEKFNDVSMRLWTEQDFVPQGREWTQIWGLMSVFERINIMVEDKILDVPLVDRLHGFRLMGILPNMSPEEKSFIARVHQLTKTTRSRNPFGFETSNTSTNA